jgi:hypothetical protein
VAKTKKRAKSRPKRKPKSKSKLLPTLLVISLGVNAVLGFAYLQGKFPINILRPVAAQKYYFLKNEDSKIDPTIGGINKLPAPYQLAASNISSQLQKLLEEASITSDSPYFVEKVVMVSDELIIVTATEGHFNEHLHLAAILEEGQIKVSFVFAPAR